MGYKLVLTKQSAKDAIKLEQAGLDVKAKELLRLLKKNPYQNPPPYEKLTGDLKEKYSRRINIQHRIIYMITGEDSTVKILRMWTYYE